MTTAPALHYDYIRPEALRINRFLFRMRAESDLRKRYLQDPKTVVAEMGLSEAEQKAVLGRDVPALVALGAHPLLAILLRVFADMDERPDNYEFY
jgi:aromatic-ring opening dioxygenase LigAB LigA subunit